MSLLELGPMLIGTEGEPFDSPDYLFELKLDCERCLAFLEEEQTVLCSKRANLCVIICSAMMILSFLLYSLGNFRTMIAE